MVQWYTQRKGALCIFPDTRIYWLLAETISEGTTYEVLQWGDNPHFALRTPGYPLFLAACRLAFGERLLPVRLVQALLGAASVWLVYRLTAQVAPPRSAGRCPNVPLLAAVASLRGTEEHGSLRSAGSQRATTHTFLSVDSSADRHFRH